MKNNFFFKNKFKSIYNKPSKDSEVTSQILYGEKFTILSQKKNWLRIKTKFDNYTGYIKTKDYTKNQEHTHKVFSLKAIVINTSNKRKTYLPFGSKISIIQEKPNYIEFEKNKWIKVNDTKEITHHETNFIKILKLFLGCKYLWGGKTSKGIDCSALIQIYFYYNRIFFPRDSKDQIKFCRRKKNKRLSKGDIIFWKGHVGMCLNQTKFIHAYGPKKKVLIMPTIFTIKVIRKTAKLIVKKISNIRNY